MEFAVKFGFDMLAFISVMVLIVLALAGKALLFPGRVVPWRQGDGGWWNDLRDDWQLWWRRRRGEP